MNDAVPAGDGTTMPKYKIASQALRTIIVRLETVAASGGSLAPGQVEVGLVAFSRGTAVRAVPLAKLDAGALRTWLRRFGGPEGKTPLGQAIEIAMSDVLAAGPGRKHVLVVTDGMNTAGPDPAEVVPKLQAQAAQTGSSVGLHLVAFDVATAVFEPLKKLGATIVAATDGKQLREQLEFILAKKILLEDEEPAPAATPAK
jgi:hypothetical protein